VNKILFALESFFPTYRAGTEVYVLNLCNYFLSKNWEVSVLISTTKEEPDYIFEGIQVYTFKVPIKATGRQLNGLDLPDGIEEFKLRLSQINPTWVHFHSLARAINGFHVEAAKNMGYKVALTPHLSEQFCLKGNMRLFNEKNCDGNVITSRCISCSLQDKGYTKPIAKILGTTVDIATSIEFLKSSLPPAYYQAKHRKAELLRIKNNVDIVFAIAPWIKKAFLLNEVTNVQLIPQGISSIFFKNNKLKDHNKPKTNTLNFIYVGRIHPIKGFHILKEAWELLDSNDICLHVLTNPTGLENDYYHSLKSWGIEKSNVQWVEGSTQEDVAYYLNNMQVLLLPSLAEVAPLVILEAAIRQIPVITSDYVAMKDVIQNGVNGWLFENGNAQSLASQLQELIKDPIKIKICSDQISLPTSLEEVGKIVEHYLIVKS
jgi:glycosyltransferase involved in cell wall biosynthesis